MFSCETAESCDFRRPSSTLQRTIYRVRRVEIAAGRGASGDAATVRRSPVIYIQSRERTSIVFFVRLMYATPDCDNRVRGVVLGMDDGPACPIPPRGADAYFEYDSAGLSLFPPFRSRVRMRLISVLTCARRVALFSFLKVRYAIREDFPSTTASCLMPQ